MNILGIETSCDETACAVVKDGREVLANVVYTQIPLHQPYGGVVPEIASRAHVEKIGEVILAAMAEFCGDADFAAKFEKLRDTALAQKKEIDDARARLQQAQQREKDNHDNLKKIQERLKALGLK